MANEEQLAILEKGVKTWNAWRTSNPNIILKLTGANLRNANLRGANLQDADLSGADLRNSDLASADLATTISGRANFTDAILGGANLYGASLHYAFFNRADLRDVRLDEADLRGAFLNNADLSRASLYKTDLSNADLRGVILHEAFLGSVDLSSARLSQADFRDVLLSSTIFADVDLSNVNNLNLTRHIGPSTIGIDTIYKSKGNIPHNFLRVAGVPENFITYMSSLTGKAFEYFSAFISYTEADDTFSKRLYEGLQTAGLHVWRWREDAKWGAPIEKNIDQAVRIYDKLIVICSEDSLKAPAVIDEISRALQKEHDLMKDDEVSEVLFPITIDDYVFDEWEHHLKPRVMSKTVGDFRGWKDPKKYDAALDRLVEALKQEGEMGR